MKEHKDCFSGNCFKATQKVPKKILRSNIAAFVTECNSWGKCDSGCKRAIEFKFRLIFDANFMLILKWLDRGAV